MKSFPISILLAGALLTVGGVSAQPCRGGCGGGPGGFNQSTGRQQNDSRATGGERKQNRQQQRAGNGNQSCQGDCQGGGKRLGNGSRPGNGKRLGGSPGNRQGNGPSRN